MDCLRWRDAISADLDGELDDDEAGPLDAHLAACAPCRSAAAAMERQHRALRLRPAEPVPDRTAAILAALDPGPAPVPWWQRGRLVVFGAAAVALAGASTYALVAPRPAPPSPQLALLDARAVAGRLGGVAEVYLYVDNVGGPDRVLGAVSPIADRVELHLAGAEGGAPAMRTVASVGVPGAGATQLEPGGPHVMLVGLRDDLRPGDVVPLTLRFERSGPVDVRAVVDGTPTP